MRKFKLIKKFPGSIKVGEVVSKQRNSHYIHEDKNGDARLFYNQEVENFPEFWEEVKEKEYTILSFISTTPSKTIRSVTKNGGYKSKDGCEYTLDSMLKDNDSIEDGMQKIHSVRRENDGIVFQLKEHLVYGNETAEIKGFKILETGEMGIEFGDGMVNIILAKKAPIRKPILVTEDKVEIFDGDGCYYVNSAWLYGDTFINKEMYEERKSHCKFFSTKEKAEEYIKWNKPMYSLNDISSSGVSSDSVRDIIYELEKLDRK